MGALRRRERAACDPCAARAWSRTVNVAERDPPGVHAAYFPWLTATTTMLDSYVDQPEDLRNGDHSYVAHYPHPADATQSIGTLVTRSLIETRALPNGHRHAVIAAAMIAMYLSKDTARTDQLRHGTQTFVRAGGTLTALMMPILRAWRLAYGQRTA